jgi:ketosteroid isomerase-like protein
MSQENVEIVRRFTQAVNQEDRKAAATLLHPEVEWHTRAGPILGVQAVTGRDEVLRFIFEQIPDGIEDFRVTLAEARSLSGNQVLVTAYYEGRGVTSGAAVEMNATQVYRFDRGMIVFFQDFATRTEALEAAGLRD